MPASLARLRPPHHLRVRTAYGYGPAMASKSESKPPDPVAVAVGSRIRQEREARRLTKEELATRAGIASRYLWRVEAGLQNIQLRNLAGIAAALELTLAELLQGVEPLMANPVDWPTPKPRGRKAQTA